MKESLPASKAISHYCILHKLGAGGMGEVYLAEDTGLHRKVALTRIECAALDSERDLRELRGS